MRIEFLTQDDPLYIVPFFEEFLSHYSGEFEVLQISCCPTMGNRSRVKMLKELTALYGPLGVARLIARAGMSRVLGARRREKGAKRYHTLAQLCRAHGVTYQKIGNPNDVSFVNSVRAREADVLVSVACPFILKEPLLALAPLGAINIHHAPLPRYKGMMPTFWQMFHGEKTVGVTIHSMVAKVDEGAALFQGEQKIEPGESLDHLIQRSKRYGAHCMAKVLKQVGAGTACATPFDHSKGSYFTFPTLDEIREFHRRGLRAI